MLLTPAPGGLGLRARPDRLLPIDRTLIALHGTLVPKLHGTLSSELNGLLIPVAHLLAEKALIAILLQTDGATKDGLLNQERTLENLSTRSNEAAIVETVIPPEDRDGRGMPKDPIVPRNPVSIVAKISTRRQNQGNGG